MRVCATCILAPVRATASAPRPEAPGAAGPEWGDGSDDVA
jgi:hypothetical protein